MQAIWKYGIPAEDQFTLDLPEGARVLSVAAQRGDVCLWAEVNPDAKPVRRNFRMCGTWHAIPSDESREFIGTALLHGGDLVFHIFEVLGP
jgi:hypothetical protein